MKFSPLMRILILRMVTLPKINIFLQIISDGRIPCLKSRRRVIQLTRNLDAEIESHPDTGRLTRIANFEASRWRMAAILQMCISHESSDFNDLCMYSKCKFWFRQWSLDAKSKFSKSVWKMDVIFKIASATSQRHCPINVRFWTMKQNGIWRPGSSAPTLHIVAVDLHMHG